MVAWLHSLSIVWLLLVVCAATALVTVAIYLAMAHLAAGEHREALGAVSPGMLPPMALVFGLLIGFLAADVWGNSSNARQAVDREASALRSVGDTMQIASTAARSRHMIANGLALRRLRERRRSTTAALKASHAR